MFMTSWWQHPPWMPRNSLRAGPNAKTTNDRPDKLSYGVAASFESADGGVTARSFQSKHYLHVIVWLQESNSSEPDVLSNCSTNNVLADLNHKPEIETKSEILQDRHGLKQSIKILGNGDNALYGLGDKMCLLEII